MVEDSVTAITKRMSYDAAASWLGGRYRIRIALISACFEKRERGRVSEADVIF